MDLCSDAGTLPTRTNVGYPEPEQSLSLTGAPCPTESRGTISLQLLEFKTHLLEVVEELHIRRDAEMRFEAQTNKLVLEKQELEWQKETLQHKIETMGNQHAESLADNKKQFQVKIRNIEEEKGKQQVSAELRGKEINSLKEELKSLQLLKYNLEKKSSEMEQKLTLQSLSKESHLNQLGEVEKRFSALARQCAMVKQAHEKLEQDVDEAIKINKKLTSAYEKQETTITYLKKELEEVNKQLIKAKMLSVRCDETHVPLGQEQQAQQLHHKLVMETEMNKKLMDENAAERAAKQELMRSLQHSQQLLLSQTQTLNKVELELRTQSQEYQALKQEHEMVQEKSKALEDEMAQLMDSYTASKITWDKEKAEFLDRVQSEEQNLQAVQEAYEQLHQKHTELSLRARHMRELEVDVTKECQNKGVQTGEVCTNNEGELEISPEDACVSNPLDQTMESVRNLESFDLTERSCDVGLHLDSCCVDSSETSISQQKDCSQILSVSASRFTFVDGTTGERDGNEPNIGSLQLVDSCQTRSPECLRITEAEQDDTGTIEGQENQINHQQSRWKEALKASSPVGAPLSPLNTYINNTSESINTPSDLDLDHNFNDGIQISKDSSFHGTRPEYGSADAPGEWLKETKGKTEVNKEVLKKEQEEMEAEKTARENKERNEEQEKWNEKDNADGQEQIGGSAEDKWDMRKPEKETKDGKTVVHSPQPVIEAQTSPDKKCSDGEKNNTPAIDFMDRTEPRPTARQPTERSQSPSESVAEGTDECVREEHLLKSCGCDDHQTLNRGQNAESLHLLPSPVHPVCEEATSEKSSKKTAAHFYHFPSEPLKQSRIVSSEANATPWDPQSVSFRELEMRESCKSTDINVQHTSQVCDGRDDLLLQSQKISDPAVGQLKLLLTESEACEKIQKINGPCENDDCVVVQQPVEECQRKAAMHQRSSDVDIGMDGAGLNSQVESDSCQDRMKYHMETKEQKSDSQLKPFVQLGPNEGESPEAGRSEKQEQLPPTEMLLRDPEDSSLSRQKDYMSSFDWAAALMEAKRLHSDVSDLQRSVQRSPASELNASGSSGFVGQTSSKLAMFLKTKQNKVPLVITSASDLLHGSSNFGLAVSFQRHRQGEKDTVRGTADTNGRSSVWMSSFPVSASSSTVSRPSLQTAPEPGCSRTTASATSPSSDSDWFPSGSQERDEQHSSLRTQISKIEQFLSTERLLLPKRRRIDN
ncbi:myosin-9-like [Thalassophryne amazonica]|uniref:myosin-9-like n=1 Tax=Thalassophryne amazonica TaxID=390379 RepID=UPI001471FEB4|nr:myosin-9-like [Thalassophryne amazonica]